MNCFYYDAIADSIEKNNEVQNSNSKNWETLVCDQRKSQRMNRSIYIVKDYFGRSYIVDDQSWDCSTYLRKVLKLNSRAIAEKCDCSSFIDESTGGEGSGGTGDDKDKDKDKDKGNNGHGNDEDGNDSSNPGNSNNGDGTDDDGTPGKRDGKGKDKK